MDHPNNYYSHFFISCLVLLIIAQVVEGRDNDDTLMRGKKLIIGVPKTGFTQFVDLQFSPTNKSQLVKVSGYAIDVFNATVAHLESLGYNISFEFTAFVDHNGNSAGSYDDLLHQIQEKKVRIWIYY